MWTFCKEFSLWPLALPSLLSSSLSLLLSHHSVHFPLTVCLSLSLFSRSCISLKRVEVFDCQLLSRLAIQKLQVHTSRDDFTCSHLYMYHLLLCWSYTETISQYNKHTYTCTMFPAVTLELPLMLTIPYFVGPVSKIQLIWQFFCVFTRKFVRNYNALIFIYIL